MRRLTEPVHPSALPFFRRVYCAALALITAYELVLTFDRYARFTEFYGPLPTFERLGLGLPPRLPVVIAGALLIAALALAALSDRLAKPALAVALLLFLFFFGTVLGWAKVHTASDHPSDHHTIHFFVLLVLLFAPRTPAAWPLLAVRASLAVAYLGAAFTKLQDSGLQWLDGFNLQTIFMEKFSMNPSLTLAAKLAQSHALCLALSWATILFELGFWTVLLLPRRHGARWLYVASGFGFHAGTWILMGIWQFVASFCAVYLVFLEWPLGRAAPMPAEPSAPPTPRAFAGVGVLLAMLAGVIGRVHFWPLADFETYARYQDYRDQVDIIACEHVQPDGSSRPCFGTGSSFIGAQVLVRMKPGEQAAQAARRWVDEQTSSVPPAQRRLLIGRTLRLTLRTFPVVDGEITVKRDVITVAQ